MPPKSIAKRIRDSINGISVLAGAASSGVPGIAYFIHWAPPLFTMTALLCSGVGLAVFVVVFARGGDRARSARQGFAFVLSAILLGSVYGLLLPALTVTAPSDRPDANARYQVGFRTLDFSLTDDARSKGKELGLRTPEDFMLSFGAYEPGGPNLIWQTWSIIAAGGLLILLFVTTFVCWAYGMARLAWGIS